MLGFAAMDRTTRYLRTKAAQISEAYGKHDVMYVLVYHQRADGYLFALDFPLFNQSILLIEKGDECGTIVASVALGCEYEPVHEAHYHG